MLYAVLERTCVHNVPSDQQAHLLHIFQPSHGYSTDTSGIFADQVLLQVSGGRGGRGCSSFARGPNKEIAPPDGGHGGNGGSVWIEADKQCRSLRYSTTQVNGQEGGRGMSAKKRGRDGDDAIVKVPLGTVVHELSVSSNKHDVSDLNVKLSDINYVEFGPGSVVNDPTMELMLKEPGTNLTYKKTLVCELNEHGQRALVAQGGRGGRGNTSYKNSANRSPEDFEEGATGESRRLELELKTIADVGLVGFPNAGKSTLLRAISRAKPRVAAYPFTTLRPHIGMVQSSIDKASAPFPAEMRAISVADIPGLIEGAHEDRGLGHDFLRHIERTTFLVYVVDVALGGKRALASLQILRNELDLYLPGLSKRKSCIVANKMDAGDKASRGLATLIEAVGDAHPIYPVSAKYHIGVNDLKNHLITMVL